MEVGDLALRDFEHRKGQLFFVEAGGQRVPLTLAEVQGLPGSVRPKGGFRLEFLGPAQPLLGQGTFPFTIDRDRIDIFIVPLEPRAGGMRYEAIFY